MRVKAENLAAWVETKILQRNHISQQFFPREAGRLALMCQKMSERFLKGGRLLAFGKGAYATDAQHVAVEFVHPVIVGKRALPALDLSLSSYEGVRAAFQPNDMIMAFASPEGKDSNNQFLAEMQRKGALTFALPGSGADYSVESPSPDPFLHQEMIEILYHTLWETVHVFFEHREMGHELGNTAFLYPFLGQDRQGTLTVVAEVEESIIAKAEDDERLREQVARKQSELIVATAQTIREKVDQGGKVLLFGNGGSATDANDLALDFALPPRELTSIPAVSLSQDPANLSAIANDIGAEAIFLRQLIAQGNSRDVAMAISTSGNSANIIAALKEARKQGMLTVALLGYDGGEIGREELADFVLVVESDYIPRIQEVQASIYHVLREAVERSTQ